MAPLDEKKEGGGESTYPNFSTLRRTPPLSNPPLLFSECGFGTTMKFMGECHYDISRYPWMLTTGTTCNLGDLWLGPLKVTHYCVWLESLKRL
jgi:hypothetical protein